jgi:polyisoprenoid-binding protein YceI
MEEIMMHKLYSAIFILLMLSGLRAQSDNWKADKAHSNIGFTVAHLVISDVQGKFTDYDVTMTASKRDFSDASVEVVIRTASINTDNEKRDNHLRSGDFFNAEKYPTITFESKSFEKTGDNMYKVRGDLTMNGITKEVVLDMNYRGQVKDPWGNVKSGFKATTVLDRYDFGLKYNSALETGGLLIGEEVQINIDLEMQM